MSLPLRRSLLCGSVALAALAMLAAPVRAQAKPVLKFTGIPNQNTTELAEKYAPLAQHLASKLGVPVEYVPSADYNASVDAFKNGDVLLAWFGGYTGCQARAAVPGARAIACGARDVRFKSYVIANKASGLTPSKEFPTALRGKQFTFGSASSTSGRLMPEYFLRQATKQSPKEFFGAEPRFSGSHDKTIQLVAAGTFDAGVVDYTVFDKWVKEKKVDTDLVRIVWTTPEYADYNFTAHPKLDQVYGPGFTDKLQAELIAIQGEDRRLLAALDRAEDGLIACTNETFELLRKTAVEIGLLR
ncbi:MAG: putative selenate ABC transporter substrate-binding protein [Planctomycetes bacterium]|nr:putative selenate ABC transporter substrate-binding protein [Planctomycetota bacterium]